MSTTTRERTSDSAPEEDVRPQDERLPFFSSLGSGFINACAAIASTT